MIGGGEFIINGSERVIVSQLHRSPGVDFSVDSTTTDKKLHNCWIIPERGSWIELNVTKKEVLQVRIDQSGKFAATTLLRAIDPKLRPTRTSSAPSTRPRSSRRRRRQTRSAFAKLITDKIAGRRHRRPRRPAKCSCRRARRADPRDGGAHRDRSSDLAEVEVIEEKRLDMLILNTLQEDTTKSHEEALLKIYSACARATRPSSRRRASSSTRSSSIPSATAWAASAASASTGSSTRRSPRTTRCSARRTSSTRCAT